MADEAISKSKGWWAMNRNGIWLCPCGVTGTWGKVAGHRRGAKNRPECQGKMTRIGDAPPVENESPLAIGGTDDTEPDVETILAETEQPAAVPRQQPGFAYDEWLPNIEDASAVDAEIDPEQLARRLNAARTVPDMPLLDGDGEWSIEQPSGPVKLSSSRESIALPVTLRVFYDWFREHGWSQGDGSIGAWITDMLLDHITCCCGLAVMIVNREEAGLGTATPTARPQ